jgi:hypothetical protein
VSLNILIVLETSDKGGFMYRIALSVMLFAVAVLPALAAPNALPPRSKPAVRRLAPDPQRLPRLLAQIRAARNNVDACNRAQVIAESRTARSLVFPAAGSVRGAGGEFFRSDVTIESFNNDIAVFWLGRGASGEPPSFIIEGRGDFGYPILYKDFVGETLGIEGGLGALWMIPLDSEGHFDPEAIIEGFSRIWTNQPGREGTVSQQFQAVDPFSFAFYYDASAIGLQHNAQYRTSWGIVNLDTVEHHYRIFPTSLANNGQDYIRVTIPAFSMNQQALSRDLDFGQDGMAIHTVLTDDWEGDIVPPFVAYATSTDNITGDGWVVLSSANWEDEDFSQ